MSARLCLAAVLVVTCCARGGARLRIFDAADTGAPVIHATACRFAPWVCSPAVLVVRKLPSASSCCDRLTATLVSKQHACIYLRRQPLHVRSRLGNASECEQYRHCSESDPDSSAASIPTHSCAQAYVTGCVVTPGCKGTVMWPGTAHHTVTLMQYTATTAPLSAAHCCTVLNLKKDACLAALKGTSTVAAWSCRTLLDD